MTALEKINKYLVLNLPGTLYSLPVLVLHVDSKADYDYLGIDFIKIRDNLYTQTVVVKDKSVQVYLIYTETKDNLKELENVKATLNYYKSVIKNLKTLIDVNEES